MTIIKTLNTDPGIEFLDIIIGMIKTMWDDVHINTSLTQLKTNIKLNVKMPNNGCTKSSLTDGSTGLLTSLPSLK